MARLILFFFYALICEILPSCTGHAVDIRRRAGDVITDAGSTNTSNMTTTTITTPTLSNSSASSNSTISATSASCTPYLLYPKNGLDKANSDLSARLNTSSGGQAEVISNRVTGVVCWLVCLTEAEVQQFRTDPLVRADISLPAIIFTSINILMKLRSPLSHPIRATTLTECWKTRFLGTVLNDCDDQMVD